MSRPNRAANDESRPDFMVELGVMPPYTIEDVMQAYRSKVTTAHPDRGGDAARFIRLQDAFEKAREYVEFRANRMGWLGSMVEKYAAQESLISELLRRGAVVE